MVKIIGSVRTTRSQCKYQEDRGVLNLSGEEGPMVLGIFDGHSTAFASDYCRRHMRTVVYQLIQSTPSIRLDASTTPAIKAITKTLDAGKFVETDVKGAVIINGSDDEGSGKDHSDDSDDDFEDDDLIYTPESEEYKCDTMQSVLRNAFKIVNEAFLGELEDGGCTACFSVVLNNTLWVANAGDSRCIVGGKDGKVKFATVDHKPDSPGEKARIVAADHTVEMVSELSNGKRITVARVDGNLACSRSIGDSDMKDFGVPQEKQAVTCVPDVFEHPIAPGVDRFVVLASDGLWDVMSSEQVAEFVYKRIKKGKIDQALVDSVANELVLHATRKLKSYDNTTVVLGVFV